MLFGSMQFAQTFRESRDFDQNRKMKYNIFMYRMKRSNNKKANSNDNTYSSMIANSPSFLQGKKSIQMLANIKQQRRQKNQPYMQQGQKKTMSPINKNLSNYYKILNRTGHVIPQMANNNLTLMFSSTSKRPLWRSLQMHSPKKKIFGNSIYQNNNTNNSSRCNLFKKNKQKDQNMPKNPEIQFYNTSNIFIFKKINSKINQHQLIPKIQSQNSAYIKYKRNNFQPLSPEKTASKFPSKKVNYSIHTINNSKKQQQKRQNKQSKVNQKQKTENGNKQKSSYLTVEKPIIHNRFHQGTYNLQPWSSYHGSNAEQQSHFPRISPIVLN